MPICISCSTPVRNLYTTYSKADDRSLGKGVRLTQCPRCKRFADKYVEHDYVVLFIDLVLIKPQVYRHLLFNRLGQQDGVPDQRGKLDPSIIRLGIILLLFDVYLTWARIEKADTGPSSRAPAKILAEAPITTQYLFFLTLNLIATLAQHAVIRLIVRFLIQRRNSTQRSSPSRASPQPAPPPPQMIPSGLNSPPTTTIPTASDHHSPSDTTPSSPRPEIPHHTRPNPIYPPPGPPSGSAISTALLVSSCTKLFPILLVIWPTSSSSSSSSDLSGPSFQSRARGFVGYAVLLNNVEALLILLDCGYVLATVLAVTGAAARWTVEKFMLGLVGLQPERGPVGDLMGWFN